MQMMDFVVWDGARCPWSIAYSLIETHHRRIVVVVAADVAVQRGAQPLITILRDAGEAAHSRPARPGPAQPGRPLPAVRPKRNIFIASSLPPMNLTNKAIRRSAHHKKKVSERQGNSGHAIRGVTDSDLWGVDASGRGRQGS